MPRKRYDIHSRNCNRCGKFYTSRSKFYCSRKCANTSPQTAEQRFWSNVNITDLFDCWLWTGCKHKDGYGKLKIKGKTISAHRFSYIINIGSINENLWVLHKCNNPSCVNPAHLYLGTTQDNTKDMVDANRQAYGERHGRAKLTDNKVKDIIILLENKIPQRKIAKMFSVDQKVILNIKKNRIWRHIQR